MSNTTLIEWANFTGGPYLGCSVVTPGCKNCYAKALAEGRLKHIFRSAYKAAGFADWETRPIWGDKATRVLSKGFWHDARTINAKHAKAGTRGRWFPSMIDWLDHCPAGIITQDGQPVAAEKVLADFLWLIHETPSLDWLLLTKRPENWEHRIRMAGNYVTELQNQGRWRDGQHLGPGLCWNWIGGVAPTNVWIGASVEDQPRVSRVKDLLKIPAPVHWLSVEPLIADVQLGLNEVNYPTNLDGPSAGPRIDWVVVGGESGPGCRPCHVEWIRSVVDQCNKSGTQVFVNNLAGTPLARLRYLAFQTMAS